MNATQTTSRDESRWASIRSALKGMRAVVTPSGVVFAAKIECGAAGAENVYNQLKQTHTGNPIAMFYDGEYRGEYGRPMDAKEIEEALVSSGFL